MVPDSTYNSEVTIDPQLPAASSQLQLDYLETNQSLFKHFLYSRWFSSDTYL